MKLEFEEVEELEEIPQIYPHCYICKRDHIIFCTFCKLGFPPYKGEED